MKKTNNYRGITLVALVITIIVLLILIGVTLQLIFSDSGAINSAIKAKEETEYASEKELVIMSVSGAQIAGKGVITTDNLNSELKLNFKDDNSAEEIPDGWIYIAKKKYTIYQDGSVVQNQTTLPAEFQEVKYIENTDLQYIDTLYCANQDTRILCECAIKDDFKSGYYQALFGATDVVDEKEANRKMLYTWIKKKQM